MPYTELANPFRSNSLEAWTVPPAEAQAIAPNDGADLPRYVRALVVAVAGTVSFVPLRQVDETAVTVQLAAGVPLAVQVRKVMATGTTATGIVGLV